MASAVRVAYVSDNGTTYQFKTLDYIATAISATPEALGAHPPLPSSIKPRYVLGIDPATGREHKVKLPAASGGLWTGATTTLSVGYPGGSITLNLAGRVAEKRYAR